jgi:hypothetical protein
MARMRWWEGTGTVWNARTIWRTTPSHGQSNLKISDMNHVSLLGLQSWLFLQWDCPYNSVLFPFAEYCTLKSLSCWYMHCFFWNCCSTLQLIPFTTLQLIPFTTLQFIPFTTLQLIPFTTPQLIPFTTPQLIPFTTLQLIPFTTLQLIPFTTLQLIPFTTLQIEQLIVYVVFRWYLEQKIYTINLNTVKLVWPFTSNVRRENG